MAATCHKVMGDTLAEACTKVSSSNDHFRLWQFEQVYVIVSRVRSLDCLTFCGSKTDTLRALKEVLLTRREYDNLMSNFCREMSRRQLDVVPRIDLSHGVFLPYYTEIPSSPHGFVFYLQSTKRRSSKVVGFTQNLKNELLSYNNLSKSTCSLQPFALICFIAGFTEPGDGEKLAFHITNYYNIDNSCLEDVISSMEQAVGNIAVIDHSSLVLVRCCSHFGKGTNTGNDDDDSH